MIFGKSYLIDLYNVKEGLCDDMEFTYRLLEELVDFLGMTKQCPPYVIHAPRQKAIELYPEKIGISAWVALIESGASIHTIAPRNFVSIDIYTCGDLDIEKTKKFLMDKYECTDADGQFVERGVRY
jgi:S-adenosylmethionine/arginine decarboxylase-like enzyme